MGLGFTILLMRREAVLWRGLGSSSSRCRIFELIKIRNILRRFFLRKEGRFSGGESIDNESFHKEVL